MFVFSYVCLMGKTSKPNKTIKQSTVVVKTEITKGFNLEKLDTHGVGKKKKN